MAVSGKEIVPKDEKMSIQLSEEEKTSEDIELFRKRILEDDRMDSIFRMGQNLTEKFDNRAYLHPHGMTDYDYKSIPVYMRNDLEKFKHKTRHENYQYLGDHPEIDGMLALFFKKLLQAQPPDPVHFAAEYFTRDTAVSNYTDLLTEERERLARYRVNKMKAAEKITTVPVYEVKQKKTVDVDVCGDAIVRKCGEAKEGNTNNQTFDYETPEALLNWLKKLNIGPQAQDFDTRDKPPSAVETKPQKPKKKKKVYCGCKDPGRRERAHPTKKPKPLPTRVSGPKPTEPTKEVVAPGKVLPDEEELGEYDDDLSPDFDFEDGDDDGSDSDYAYDDDDDDGEDEYDDDDDFEP